MPRVCLRSMLLAAALQLALLALPPAAIATETLVARVTDWKPFYFEAEGRWQGLVVDSYRALAEEAGLAIEFVPMPFARGLAELERGHIQVMALLTPTKEREVFTDFVGPHFFEEMALVINQDYATAKIRNLDDLVALAKSSGLKIWLQKDVHYSDELNSRLKDRDFQDAFYTTARPPSADPVAQGRLLGYLDQRVVALYELHNRPDAPQGVAVHPFTLSRSAVYFGISRKTEPAILERLRAANRRLIDRGVYEAISAKWKN